MSEEELHPDRVPDCESASVDDRKFTHYLLNESHTKGGAGKAKFFKEFGYDQSNWTELRDAVMTQVPKVPGRYSRTNDFGGTHYEAEIRIEAPKGTIDVSTFWEVHPKTGTKFLTAFPAERDTDKKDEEQN